MSSQNDSHLDTAHLAGSLQAKTVRGGIVTLAGRAARVLVEGVLIVVMSRLLSPSDIGLVGMALVVTRFVQLFKDLGLNMATVQRDEISQAQVSALFWVNAGAGLLLTLLVVATAPLVAWFYGHQELVAITMWFSLAVGFAGVSAQHLALLRRQMRFGALALVEVAGGVLGLTGSIALAVAGYGYWALVANAVLAAGGSAIAAWIFCSWRPSGFVGLSGVRELIAFGGHVTGANVTNYLARNLDSILIGKFLGANTLGLYQRAYELVLLPVAQVCVPIGYVAIGTLSRLKDEADRYREAFRDLFCTMLLINLPLAAWALAIADVGVPLVLGPQWERAARIFVLLGPMLAIQPVGHAVSWLMTTQGRTGELLKTSLLLNAMSAVVVAVSIRWGVEAVAASYALSGFFLRMPVNIWYATRAGPVGALAVCGPFLVFLLGAATTLGAVLGVRHLVPLGPLGTIALSLPVGAFGALVGIVPFSTGRHALGGAYRTVRNLVRARLRRRQP
jgi:O-antigen/teichoic acid export membrane protein